MVEFDHFKQEAGLHTFVLSVSEWIQKTNAVGLFVKKGRYGGTFAHKDIAFEFASAISPIFKLYLIKEFQRLKEDENNLQQLEWNAKRFLSKNNYLIQTDAIKNYIIPVCNYREDLKWLTYAEEADLLNVALFGFTAKMWRDSNPELAKVLKDIALYQMSILDAAEKIVGIEENPSQKTFFVGPILTHSCPEVRYFRTERTLGQSHMFLCMTRYFSKFFLCNIHKKLTP